MKRIQNIQKTLSADSCAVFISPINRRYLTNFRSSDGVLLVTKEEAYLYLDSRYFEMAFLAQKDGAIPRELKILPAQFTKDFLKMSKEGAAKKAYFEDRYLTVARLRNMESSYPDTRFEPLGDQIEQMRVIKTEEEIGRIRAAQAMAEDAYLYILPRLEKGRTEKSVAAELEYYMKLHGGGASFGTICVSGTRSSLPHGAPTMEPIGENVFVTMDFGCLLDGYCSDMTRTVCVGKATDEMRLVYDTVLKAQENAIAAVRAGVPGKVVDAAARDLIAAAGYGDYFGHSTGHGIGLEVHEAPGFSTRSENPVPEGAVLSVEPGIYLPGKFGVRIEDLVVVRQDGAENLNATSKKLLEL